MARAVSIDMFTFSTTDLSPDDLAASDRAHAALTDAVRELAEAQLRTRVALPEVERVTAEVRELTGRLLEEARDGWFGIELDHDGGAREHGNAALGLRNPFAAATGEHAMFWGENGASATLELGPLYEGPPSCVHGGVIALVMDQLFTEAAAAAGEIGMTASMTISYRRPTPLGTVVVEAWLEQVDGLKRTVKGTCTDAGGRITAEAEALLILPKAAANGDGPVWPKRPPRR